MSANYPNAYLEKHAFMYAQAIRSFIKTIPPTIGNIEDAKHAARTSGMLGETFIRANESASKHDYLMGIKNCVTEARTSIYWLNLIDSQGNPEIEEKRKQIIKVATELTNILSRLYNNAAKVRSRA